MAIKFALLACLLTVTLQYVRGDNGSNYLDIEPPNFFNYNSPLRQPDSLRSRPYFDFLSTLYRRDVDKSSLFRPYTRARRDIPAPLNVVAQSPAVSPQQYMQQQQHSRRRRAVVFRPLFVYRQQQIKRKRVNRN